MSDLARGVRTSNGGSRGVSGRSAAQAQQGSPAVKTPTQIMKDRRARQAAQDAQRNPDAAAAAADSARDDTTAAYLQTTADRPNPAAVSTGQYPRDSGYQSQGPSVGGRTPAQPPYNTPVAPSSNAATRDPTARTYGSATSALMHYDSGEPSRGGNPHQTTGNARAAGYSTHQEQTRAGPAQHYTSPARSQQPQTSNRPAAAQGAQSSQTPRAQSASQPVIAPSADGAPRRSSNVSSFPHAFERWETLSSRWEGLTSYWLGRLERNTQALGQDPERQQMSRQITDLSAAGANLFHAVVELQRLRASSERKFQRWFFETRDQQEQAQEAQANLQRMLEEERQARADDTRVSQRMFDNNRILQETRRELEICKDEARRAWEELGRREQTDRDKVLALRDGHPVNILEVQIMPMRSQEGNPNIIYANVQDTGRGQTTPRGPPGPTVGTQEYYDPNDPSPTNTDPFSGRDRPGATQYMQYPPGTAPGPSMTAAPQSAAAITARQLAQQRRATADESPSARFYTHQETFLHDPRNMSGAGNEPSQYVPHGPHGPHGEQIFSTTDSDDDLGYEVDDDGHVRRDASGNPIPFRGLTQSYAPVTSAGYATTSGPSEYRVQTQAMTGVSEGQIQDTRRYPQQYGPPEQNVQASQAVHGHQDPRDVEPADYEGASWGEEERHWDDMAAQRHHHPTRLSDVVEEDERSRASASGQSRGSGGMF